MKSDLVREIEKLEFQNISKIKEDYDKELYFKSFHKTWNWIMEVFFNTPRSKYHWPEFS